MKRSLSTLFLFVLALFTSGQDQGTEYFQGYAAETGGKRFSYHSPIPSVSNSLLLRGQADYEPIEWMSEAIPEHHKYLNNTISFIWLFGMDVTDDPVRFNLAVNGTHCLSFISSTTSDLGERKITGNKGAELILNVTMLDKYEDQMGFAILTLPAELVQSGKPVHFRLSSPTKDNNAWFMTFKSAVYQSIDIYQNKVVAKKDGMLFHTISIDFVHVGAEAKASVLVGDQKVNASLRAGFNKLEIYLPRVTDTTAMTASVSIEGAGSRDIPFTLAPVREWEIFLVQHTHTDIGYTRPQTEILPEHLRYIDNALDFCDQTDNYPDAAKFRWTCETSWSVREYLRSRPQEQVDRLIQRIREGRIEATGMFLNFSEIIDEPALAAQTRTLKMLKNRGIDVSTAMQNDVNGIAWCLVDYYHNTDVKYLTMGIHAHRARKPFNKPTSFWWQSPAGNRLLAYRSEHYMHGNTLALTTGQQDVLRNNLSQYLTSLEEKGYPYDKISLQFSGYITDNSPPSTKACDIIRDWNEKYEWPKLRSALARDFMIYLDQQHHDDIPEKAVAWPDWWTDGVASAANETKVVRETHAHINAITGILSFTKILGMDLPSGVQSEVEGIYDNLLFYDEHTHGAAESVSDPLAQNTINQWGMKSAYAWEAAKKAHALEEKALAFIEPAVGKQDKATIAVFNTLNWARSGLVEVFLHFEVAPAGSPFTITGPDGKEVPYQKMEQRQEGTYCLLWVDDIPPLGYKTFQVNPGQEPKQDYREEKLYENAHYRLRINTDKGMITSLFDKDLQAELLDPEDSLSLGAFIYEQLDNRHELERLTNNNRDTVYKPLGMKRSMISGLHITGEQRGAIYNSIFLNGAMPVCADERGVDIEIRMYRVAKKIELRYRMHKLGVSTPEAVYIAFPFRLDDGRLAYEAQGGVVYPGINQLEGTSSDWNAIQSFASVRNSNSQILLSSNEIPLVQFGAINTGRYYYRLKPATNHIFSWVLNNYWVTNFKASQEGELRWGYSISSGSDNTDVAATKFGWSEKVPMPTRIILPRHAAKGTRLYERSLIDLGVSNLLLVNMTPSLDGTGVILQVRETAGDHAVIDILRIMEESGASRIEEVNVLEEKLAGLYSPLLIEHYETKFLKFVFSE